MATKKAAAPWVIVRASGAGVHAGQLASRDSSEVTLTNTIRLWRWVPRKMSGQLSSLSEAAVHGINRADERARTGARVASNTILGAVEVITIADSVIVDFSEDT